MLRHTHLCFLTTNFQHSQKGVLYDDDSRNRGGEYLSDKSHVSKTINASSLATAISESANFEGVELVAGRCCARSRTRNNDNRWVICTGLHICKCAGRGTRRKERRELCGSQASMLRCTSRGNHKVGVI
jgi:hypothetical protein